MVFFWLEDNFSIIFWTINRQLNLWLREKYHERFSSTESSSRRRPELIFVVVRWQLNFCRSMTPLKSRLFVDSPSQDSRMTQMYESKLAISHNNRIKISHCYQIYDTDKTLTNMTELIKNIWYWLDNKNTEYYIWLQMWWSPWWETCLLIGNKKDGEKKVWLPCDWRNLDGVCCVLARENPETQLSAHQTVQARS